MKTLAGRAERSDHLRTLAESGRHQLTPAPRLHPSAAPYDLHIKTNSFVSRMQKGLASRTQGKYFVNRLHRSKLPERSTLRLAVEAFIWS